MSTFKLTIASVVIAIAAFGLGFSQGHIHSRWYKCHAGAECDLQGKLSEVEWDARQAQIDDFRECQAFFVQGELEKFNDLLKRIPHQDACVILRKNPQFGTLKFPSDGRNLAFYGGEFADQD